MRSRTLYTAVGQVIFELSPLDLDSPVVFLLAPWLKLSGCRSSIRDSIYTLAWKKSLALSCHTVFCDETSVHVLHVEVKGRALLDTPSFLLSSFEPSMSDCTSCKMVGAGGCFAGAAYALYERSRIPQNSKNRLWLSVVGVGKYQILMRYQPKFDIN